ncbi:MAG: translocation/assembly module TamB domain-containing protein [Gemmatimonadaceae bacterium]
MTRRRFIALVSLCVLGMLGFIGFGVGYFATHTETGQEQLRQWVQARLASAVHGKVYVGRITGGFLTGITIDSVSLRDEEDSLLVATGRVRLEYDPRDLVDRRLHFRRVLVEHPNVVLRQHEDYTWNYNRMFKRDGPSRPKGPERGFGDFVVLDSVHLRGAQLRLTIPWHVDDSLRGAKRDSALRANLAREDHEIRRTREGYTQNYRWTEAYAAAPHLRIADPDSTGRFFRIDTMHAVESVPTFKWRNVSGTVRQLGDSAWLDLPHFDLPGSTGHASGKIVWGSEKPVRYALRIWGDSVSLADVAWVYPTLPRSGGGKMILDIKNESNLRRLDYVIHDMDVRTTKSRLIGDMTFETGGPVLSIHDVKLKADPLDWDLLRALNGKPFPADWQGTLTGTVVARGGPVTRFFVDAADMTFQDAHVPGAESRFKGHGELDILFPAFTAFHRFTAQTDRLDLRTLVRLYPAFPRVTGIISGSAVLDSSWLDVRVSNANLTHTDGPAEPTHMTGAGRITYGETYMAYDLTLQAAPLSLTTLALSYPLLPLRGTFAGPLIVRGTAPALEIATDLTGAAGHITYGGTADADSVGGFGARGSGVFEALNATALVGRTTPPSLLSGRYDVDLTGATLADLAGSLAVQLDRSEVDGVRFSDGRARARFEAGILRLDTLQMNGPVGLMSAQGTLGLTRTAGDDSLVVSLMTDSLGGLRRFLGRAVIESPTGAPPPPDTLSGAVTARTVLRGWLDSLDVRGTIEGRELNARSQRARAVRGTIAVQQVRGHSKGSVSLRADSAVVGGLKLDGVNVAALIIDKGRARFDATASAGSGMNLRAGGEYASANDTVDVRLDNLALAIGTSRWGLLLPMHARSTPMGLAVDTLLLGSGNGRLSGFASLPTNAPVRAHFRADGVPLADIGKLAQLTTALSGRIGADLDVSGTKAAPVIELAGAADSLRVGGLSAESMRIGGRYGAGRAAMDATLVRGGRSILDASIDYPVALTLFTARATSDSLRGRIHADSVDLALVEALSPKLRNATGRLALDLAVSGKPDRPHVGGLATVRDGSVEIPEVGIRFAAIDMRISVDAQRDSLTIDRLRWASPASGGSASLGGSVVFRDVHNPVFDLRLDASGLRAVDKRGLARLDISTGASGLTLTGTEESARLSGAVNVNRGTIYIPELVNKKLVDFTQDEFAELFDTTDVRNRSLMPQPPGRLVEHLRLDGVSVNVGDEVWLRSKEANIKLGGSLNVTRARDVRETTRSTLGRAARGDSALYRLALAGALSADRGTYALDLGVVQREFQVQSGRITFFGTADFNPQIDVSALYRVKQSKRADIGVKARIVGPFYPQPALELSSDDAYISQTDLVAYLVTGRPSFELNESGADAAQRAYEVLLPTGGALLSRALREQLGGWVDMFQIQTGASDQLKQQTAASDQFRSVLFGTRLGGEKQISDRLFLSFSTGLCQFGNSENKEQTGVAGFVNSIEGKLEYRFPLLAPDQLSLRAGREPGASALRCGSGNVRGFVATPQQWGLSLFRSWSF